VTPSQPYIDVVRQIEARAFEGPCSESEHPILESSDLEHPS
jgi:hypothetical protein